MSDQNEYAKLEWRDDRIPVSKQFDDPYFSLDDGLAETRHVFLDGNDLPTRFKDGFHIAELGFGSGLNLLAAWQAWEMSGQKGVLYFTSFEAFPMSKTDMQRAQKHWPELAAFSKRFLAHWNSETGTLTTPNLCARVVFGDARHTLPLWQKQADAWFLDGFSPAKNPELWGGELMTQVARKTAPNGTLATYTAAGHVRQALANGGFAITRVKGFGRKRHMTRGLLKSGK